MTEQADVVIIGSGVAGALCAWRLATRGLRILVLEAGPRVTRSDIIAGVLATPKRDLSAGYPRAAWAPRPDWSAGKDKYMVQSGPQVIQLEYLRLVGGTTWHWNSGIDRLLPADFRMKSTFGVGIDWPISYEEIEPYYVEAERELGVAGREDRGSPRSSPFPMPPLPLTYAENTIAAKLRDIGISVNHRTSARNSIDYDGRPRCDGFGTCTPICPTGAQYSAIVHVEKAEHAGARVLADYRVDRIDVETSGRVTGVTYGRPDGSTGRAEGRIVILAANAIESPRILLASANETVSRGIANTSDLVGRNLMDHPTHHGHFETADPIYAGRGPMFTGSIDAFRTGADRHNRAAYMMLFDSRIGLFQLTAELLASGPQPPQLDTVLRERAMRRFDMHVETEQLPDPTNRVTIDWTDRDSAGQPRIHLHYAIGNYERLGLANGIETLQRIGRQLNAKRLTIDGIAAAHHPTGTLRMGNDPKTSVVDKDGRCHDHPNLFITGGAAFPTCGSCGPTITIAALALRTADAIGRQLG